MKLNDFQYNWYLHFEEENEKSIIGLPFDPYFEAHKFDEESILGFVERARRFRQLRTRWISVFTSTCNKIETLWGQLKLNPKNIACGVILGIPLVSGLMGNNLWYIDEAFNFTSFVQVEIPARINYVLWNIFLMINAVSMLSIPITIVMVLEAFGVKTKPNRRDLAMIIALLFCI